MIGYLLASVFLVALLAVPAVLLRRARRHAEQRKLDNSWQRARGGGS